ncbi:uncharacterized protein N7511_000648 [Penicillium nucicola]|uniref:uncharacterized protein n=1 Tax=Penicillium nucicola TaxID=1850975 RepID=UPI002544FB99|nr:uncharacterized protein N7511_000648 [Penicillium nucicola]KAJ5775637.1 hypothetical protein N7511_000648 [Penicillium nucicola]
MVEMIAQAAEGMFSQSILQDETPSGRRSAGCSGCRRAKKGCDMQFPVCGRCLRLSQTCYRAGAGSNTGKGAAYSRLGNAWTESAQDTVDQDPGQSDAGKSDKKGSGRPRSLGEWSDILRYFTDHELIRGLVAACRLQVAIPQMNPKQAADIYGAALSSIREAIQDGCQVADDTVLVITLLLYIYELDVAFCNNIVPPYFLILGSQAMGRDVLYHAHDQLAILETRTIVLYRQYCRGNLNQAFLQTAHTLQQDLTYRQKTTVRPPSNSRRHRQESLLIDDAEQAEDEYITMIQDRWSGAKLHILQLVVCRVQSAIFRKLWNSSAVGLEELVPCCQNCPTRTSQVMYSSAAEVMDAFGSIYLSMPSPLATLGMHGAIITASSCLESEIEESMLASGGVQSDAIINSTQLNSMRRNSRWLTEWSETLAT